MKTQGDIRFEKVAQIGYDGGIGYLVWTRYPFGEICVGRVYRGGAGAWEGREQSPDGTVGAEVHSAHTRGAVAATLITRAAAADKARTEVKPGRGACETCGDATVQRRCGRCMREARVEAFVDRVLGIKREPTAGMTARSDHGTLCNYRTGDAIRAATAAEREESMSAAASDGGAGVIVVEGVSCYVSDNSFSSWGAPNDDAVSPSADGSMPSCANASGDHTWSAVVPGSARCETCLCRRIDDGMVTRYIEGPTTVEALASATGDSDGPMYIAIAGQDVGTCAALGWASLSIHPYVLAEDADAATAHHMAAQRAGHDDIHVRQVR